MSVFIGYPSFMAYQMMKGKKDNNDGFPSIPGMIARYSALGLTNEQMAANPVWVDKTGNGYDIQLKNFSWNGMSGVGGYEMNFNLWRNNVSSIPDISMSTTTTSVSVSVGNSTYNNNLIYIYINNWDINKNHWLKVTSTYEDGDLAFIFYNDSNTKKIRLPANGYVNILAYPEFKGSYMYISTISNKQGSFTIEQLPLYSGALVFDGVDDYGVCENFPILTKEKGYTVVALRQWITREERALGLVSNVKNWLKDGAFLLEYRNIQADHLNKPISFGAIGSENDLPHILTYQTSKSYNGVSITTGNFEGTDVLHVGKLAPTNVGTYINAAIWELVFLDHDATEEELTKIKDYFVKTYPWLFPDQAWTVVGKTKEDEDRATIANITGNGNDLVLSNFGFAENSGYGLYGEDFFKWLIHENRVVATKTSKLFNITSIKEAVLQLYYQSTGGETGRTIPSYTIKVTGLTDGQKIIYKSNQTDLVSISSDGIHKLPSFEFLGAGDYYGFAFTKVQESCDITIEQIPEYEGYLVTDGVDDKIQSSNFSMGKDFTVVGEWKMLKNSDTYELAGINKYDSFILYNYSYDNRINVYIHSGQGTPINTDSIKAFTSTGLIYIDNFNNVEEVIPRDKTDHGYTLFIGYNNNVFTKLAFKNLAIYSEVLSKEDCIKSYIYLQTLKAKI